MSDADSHRRAMIPNGTNLDTPRSSHPITNGLATIGGDGQTNTTLTGQLANGNDTQIAHENSQVNVAGQHGRGGLRETVDNLADYHPATPIAFLDLAFASRQPVVDLYIRQIHKRDEYRQRSSLLKDAIGVVCNFGLRIRGVGSERW